jgi:hypothetical protein
MTAHPPEATAWAARSIRQTVVLATWTAAWVASLALAAFGPRELWNEKSAPTAAAIVLSVVVGIGMLLAHKRHLQGLDELQRSVQLQAMAWTLGAGLVGGMALTLLARFDLVAFEAEIAHLVGFMAVVYVVAVVAGLLRYR